MIKIFNKKERTKAQLERGIAILESLNVVINVLYALMIFQTFLILPRPDDPDLEYFSLREIFSENTDQLLTILVGLVLTIIYWIQFNKQLGNLIRSTPVHATLAIFQMFCLMLYLYFLRFDMIFDGMELALQMQSVFLALAGFVGVLNWIYARRNELTSDQIDDFEEMATIYKLLPEPTASLISLPFAVVSPMAWSISFLSIIPLTYFFNFISRRRAIAMNSQVEK